MIEETRDMRKKFREAVKSIIELMKKRSKPRSIYYLSPEIDLVKRAWHLELKTKTIFPSVMEFYDDAMKLESVKECLDLMVERKFPKRLETRIVDKDGKPVENPDYRPFLMSETLVSLTYRYLELYGFKFLEENFEKLYNEMIAYVYSTQRELIVVSPLENFELNGIEEFSIDEYKVRRLTEWEVRELIEHGYRLGFVFSPEYGSIDNIYCVERIMKAPKRSTPPLESFIQDFVTLLRIFKHDMIGCGPILHYPKIWRMSWGMSLSTQAHRLAPKYVLSKDDIQPLTSLWEQFIQAKNKLPNNVKFALRWFDKSYEERETLDRVLDLAIALEVLFGTSDRLDLYVLHFIGLDREEKLALNEVIKDLRKIRGGILHSGYYKVKPEFADTVENIFRRSARKFLGLIINLSYEEIKKEIRTSILS